MKARNLIDAVNRTVCLYPEKDALLSKVNGSYSSISYQAFWEKVRNTAAGLASLGISENNKVAIISENNPNWPICDLAIMSLKAVSVPIHSTLPPDQISYILQNSDCTFVFVENEKLLQKVLQTNQISQKIAIFYPDENFLESDHIIPFHHLCRNGEEKPLENWEEIWKSIERDDLATIIHTSGTTGLPKGAMLSHGNILSNLEGVQFWMIEARPTDIFLSHLPLSHVFERMAGQFMPLSIGATIAYAENIDTVPENLLEVRPTVLVSVPLLFERVYSRAQKTIDAGTPLRRKIFDWAVSVGIKRYHYYLENTFDQIFRNSELPKDFRRQWKLANKLVYNKIKSQMGGRLRGLISGGGALNPKIAEFFWAIDLPVLEGYGLTETSPVVCVNPMARTKVGTVGKPLPNLDIRISDDGEVMVKGPSVMKGYYKNEEATSKQFKDGWFLTGDIGQLDPDGFLKIIDRKKRIIVLTSGKNVAPQPVENAINQSIYVQNSVLIGQNRKFVSVLITLDFENIVTWSKKNGIKGDKERLIRNEAVQSLLKSETERFTKGFPSYEQPKKLLISCEEWTVESGELTPSLKVRLPEIERKYQETIERAYSDQKLNDMQMAADETAVSLSLSKPRRERENEFTA
ncbi:long-chain fatty acid--CoA ligase [Bacillus sp. V59.32b]|uniref:AMP-dependent synthetase/ligase n=1 Tax=Bacillus sp. V59.32b TaxID=1758642 RepID=UPI000E3E0C86|nr:long-chain fatty acid--CoA ligase [Bacillus sp. V59.32b]RFU64187.1 long-chain fatty acid--CoA ligase [Bacillus sp. V59.32b]